MKKIILIITTFLATAFAFDDSGITNIAGLSFIEGTWVKNDNLIQKKTTISDLTSRNKAVILYFAEACFS